MLKFSGWSCLISGQNERGGGGGVEGRCGHHTSATRAARPRVSCFGRAGTARSGPGWGTPTAACGPGTTYQAGDATPTGGGGDRRRALCFSRPGSRVAGRRDGHIRPGPAPSVGAEGGPGRGGELTLRQAYSRPGSRVQYAFKDSMIHGILQFTLRIAFRCVLHRCGSQDIRC